MFEVEQHRFRAANLTLQTLINTYPDSEYASKAKQALDAPRIAPCGESWTSSPQCIDRRVNNPRPKGLQFLDERLTAVYGCNLVNPPGKER